MQQTVQRLKQNHNKLSIYYCYVDAGSLIGVASLYHLQIFCHQIPSPQISNLLGTSKDGAILLYIILSSEEILSLIHVGCSLALNVNR